MKKIYIIGIGLLLIIISSTVALRVSSPTSVQTNTPIPTPFTSITPNPTIKYIELKKVTEGVKVEIINKLPVITEGYSIEYLKTSDRFVVSIKQNPASQYKKEAKEWFRQNGVADPDSANIYYVVPSFVQE